MGSEEEQKEALREYQRTSIEDSKRKRKERRKKEIITLLFFIFLWILLSSFNLIPRLFPKYVRMYDVHLNDTSLEVVETIQSDKFLFGLFNLENGLTNTFFEKSSVIEKEPFFLSIKSYSCYIPNGKKKIKTSCSEQKWKNKYKIENQDTKYKMSIKKYKYEPNSIYRIGYEDIVRDFLIGENYWKGETLKEYEKVMEGDLEKNITDYIKEKGVYGIQIDFSYKHNKGNIAIGVINDGEKVVSIGTK